jgi:hypothetical protein
MRLSTLAGRWDLPLPDRDVDVAFLDVEGKGEQGDSYDFRLLAPAALLCPVVLFSCKGYLEPATMLKELEALQVLATLLHDQDNTGAHGLFGSRKRHWNHLDKSTVMMNRVYRFICPAVHILVRDYTGKLSEGEFLDDLLAEEPLPPANHRRERQAVERRNAARATIARAFRGGIFVHTFPCPAGKEALEAHQSLPFDCVTDAFRTKARELAGQIVKQLAQAAQGDRSKGQAALLSATAMPGHQAASLLSALVTALNEDPDR